MSKITTLPPEKDHRTVLGFMVAEREERERTERERTERERRKREVEANSRIRQGGRREVKELEQPLLTPQEREEARKQEPKGTPTEATATPKKEPTCCIIS